ncbi:MAG: peptidoglycan-associated lipoprotein Pal [Nitrospirae bacterium]|nr:peptidoglycan-associated lipoprotein Pal [Nitrospirota bacterium]
MKKILILLLMVFVIGCAQKHVRDAYYKDAARCKADLYGGDGTCEEAVITVKDASAKDKETKEDKKGDKDERQIIADESVISEEGIKDIDLTNAEVRKEIDLIFKDVLFDYDKYDLRDEARAQLDAVAAWLMKNRKTNLIIEGHSDDRGTNEYNLALGEKRAKAAGDYLLLRGVSAARMNLLTYGEEKPACMDQSEDCWQRNRRAHFVVTE